MFFPGNGCLYHRQLFLANLYNRHSISTTDKFQYSYRYQNPRILNKSPTENGISPE